MLDPTTDGYFVNEDNVPLSMYEIRTNYLNSEFLTLVSADDKDADLRKAAEKNESINLYFLKNCFRISFETYNGFGERKGSESKICRKNTCIFSTRRKNTSKRQITRRNRPRTVSGLYTPRRNGSPDNTVDRQFSPNASGRSSDSVNRFMFLFVS